MSMNLSSRPSKYNRLPVPVMLDLLELIRSETHDDAVLVGVSRTLSQAIDELTAVRRIAVEVMHEQACEVAGPHANPSNRRLC